MSGHVAPKSMYIGVWLALLVGTGLTVLAAEIDLGALNNIVMLAIACTKAILVILFFMHVRWSTRLTREVSVPVVLLLAIGGGWYWTAVVQAAPVKVAPVTVKPGGPSAPGAVLNASGYIVARRRATVSSKVTGKVVDVLIEEGHPVKAGQI